MHRRFQKFAFALAALASAAVLPARAPADESPRGNDDLVYPHAVVAADHPAASEAGTEILRQGGNVVDAAVATAFALSVVRPASSGIGGGGFMVIWDARKREAVALDYRERAPAKATRNMFIEAERDIEAGSRKTEGVSPPVQPPDVALTPPSQKGHLAVAVPGHVAGLCYALEHYGTLELSTVLAPALRLAREGVPVDEHDLSIQAAVLREFADHPAYEKRFAPLYRQYANGGKRWKLGDRFYSPQRRVLQRIAADGPDAFYAGPVADALVAEMRRGGGLITHEDLKSTKPVVRKPLNGTFDGREIFTMPPPSSGGIALLETLNILSAYEGEHDVRLEKLGRTSPDYVHLLTEAMKHAFADRAEHLGDADFVDVPIARLTSPAYAARLAAKIKSNETRPLEEYGRYLPVDDGGTTHFSIIDAQGNAVACTETINTLFGSFVVEPEYGIVLNNQMDDFAAVPGKPNAFGLMQSEANAVAPGKKPLSSMTPTIVVADGKATHVAGASGGPRIISATLQVLLNQLRFGMTPHDAVAAPRAHHQWLPDILNLEPPLIGPLRDALEVRGHNVERRAELGVSQSTARTPEGVRGASDPRKHGRPAGY